MTIINRREFVKRSAAATAAPLVAGSSVWGANDRIQAACVGLRGRGGEHIEALSRLPGVDIAAICDVDQTVLEKRRQEFVRRQRGEPKTYTDFRDILDRPDIDAVFFATPNHWHALGTIWACQAGKDVYVEKPASHNIWEGRKMVEAAHQHGRIVQTGHQSRSQVAARAAIDFLHSGQLGDVYMARGLCFKWRDTIGKTPRELVPDGVDYDLWLGPAPQRPFSRNRFHYNWHWHWDYGNGDIGNQGVHQLDVARWGLGIDDHPVKVSASGAHVMFDDDQETPNILSASFEYPSTGSGRKRILNFEVRHWITNSEGGLGGENTIGVIFYGSEGYLSVDSGGNWKSFLGKKREPGPQAEAPGDHFKNFLDAVRKRDAQALNCNLEEGHKSAALAHLANISYRLDRSLHFDPATERFKADEEANSMLSRDYRPPFVVPADV